MAFFKFRKSSDEPAGQTVAPESVEAMRQRAKHRLIGAAVLVLAGVVGFPLLFDNQPRPIAVDIAIEIPDKAQVKPLTIASPATAGASAKPSEKAVAVVSEAPSNSPLPMASSPVTLAPDLQPTHSPPPAARVAGGSITAAVSAPGEAKSAAAKSVASVPQPAVPAATPSRAAASGSADAARALALLEGKEVLVESKAVAVAAQGASAADPSGRRFIVQVGAYTEVLKAREARQKLERAGLKTYTQVIEGAEGKRIRVRIGPYESKAQADKAAEKVRSLELPAAILEL